MALRLCVVAFLTVSTCLARGPITIMQIMERSTFVVIATLESVTPLTKSANPNPAPYLPVPPPHGAEWYPCRARLNVDYVLKPGGAPRTFDILIYSFFRDCRFDWQPNSPLPKQAVWFLRQEGARYRPAMDWLFAFRKIHSLPKGLWARLDSLPDITARIGYVLLSPGIVTPQPGMRATFAMPSIWVADYIRVLREIYIDSTPQTRHQIEILAAESWMCLEKSGVKPREPIDEFDAYQSKYIERHVRTLSGQLPADKREAIRDGLQWFACTSTKTLRAKSRELLQRFFYIAPHRIVCIPCE